MLVLTRKLGESIIIGHDIRVTIIDLGQGRVKIGVQAPDNISVDREEVHDKKSNQSVPITMLLHNRITEQLPTTTEAAPEVPPQTQGIDYRKKSR